MTRAFAPLVLCYHAVSATWEHALSLPPERLESGLASLRARGHRPGTLDDVLDGRRVLHATFDDAFRSVAAALPALERHGVPATVFACSTLADTGAPLDVPELAAELAARPHELSTMDWDALRELQERGIEVGSHTATHPHLPRLGDDELRRELVESRERIEDALGRRCRVVAYPFGDEDARVRAAARAAGYDAAFALPGVERPVDRHALPRVGAYRGDGRVKFALKTHAPARRAAAAALRAAGRRR